MTIYTANSAAWIKQGNRLVKTWPSGLCLIQQDYIGPTKLADYDQFKRGDAIDDATPCIDGAVIFPDPEYQDLGDGFTRCTVSAYGRTNITGNKTLTKTISEHTAQWRRITGKESNPLAGFNTRLIPTIRDQLVWTFVVPKTAAPNVTATDSLNIYRLNGQSLSPLLLAEFFNVFGHRTEGSVQQITKPVSSEITRAECVNFGAFDEWTVVYNSKVENSLFNFGTFLIISAPQGDNRDFELTVGESVPISNSEFYSWDSNNSKTPEVLKVWNINAANGSWSSSTPRQEMLAGVDSPTYRGGTLRRSNTASTATAYSPPSSAVPGSGAPAPARQINTLQNAAPPPSYTSGAFTWTPVPTGSFSDSFGTYIIYTYQLANSPVTDVFEVEIGNELGQTSKYSVVVKFLDPPQ
jgi:hypothetical protein